MKKLLPILSLALVVRVLIPWHEIFGEYIKFACPDSYFFMRQAVTGEITNPWSWFLRFPSLVIGNTTQNIEHTAVFIAPVLACFIVWFVYLIGKHLFNERTGLLSALAVAIIPGEFYGRSILGSTDYHIAEVFLTTGAMTCIVLGEKKNNWWYALGAFVCMVLYTIIWPGHWLFIGLLGLYALYKIWNLGGKWKPFSYIGITAGIYLLWEFGVLTLVFDFPEEVLNRTGEAQTSFSLAGILGFYIEKSILAFILGFLALKNRQYLLGLWSIVMAAATIWQIRFDYYLAIPLSITIGYVLGSFYQYSLSEISAKAARNVMIVLLITYVGFCGVYYGTIHISDTTPPDELINSCFWIKENTSDDIVIVSWWDYGYWIEYYSEREALADNGQGNVELSNKIMSEGPKIHGVYIISDNTTCPDGYFEAYDGDFKIFAPENL